MRRRRPRGDRESARTRRRTAGRARDRERAVHPGDAPAEARQPAARLDRRAADAVVPDLDDQAARPPAGSGPRTPGAPLCFATLASASATTK